MIFDKPFSDITIDDIRKLVEDKIQESSILDYKRELTSNKDIAKDVSAFANSEGGAIIYGVGEDENHLPSEINGVEGEKLEEKIENVILTGVRPRLKCAIRPILINEVPARWVIVVLAPPSLSAPHMVSIDRDNRYYKRFNFSSVPMEEYEVRALFERGKSFMERVDKELEARKCGLAVPEPTGSWWTFISCPLFLDDRLVPIDEEHREWLASMAVRPGSRNTLLPLNPRPSFNGFFMEEEERRVEVSRQGVIEYNRRFNGELFPQGREYIPSQWLAEEFVAFLSFSTELYQKVAYYGPVRVLLRLVNIKGYRLAVGRDWILASKICESQHLPQIFRGFSVPISRVELLRTAKDILDHLYQAFGYMKCQFFDEEGNFTA